MWRWLTIFLFGGVLGAAFGVALGFFLFPFVFPPPEAMEQLTPAERGKLVAKGAFINANPSDPIHYGKGEISVYPGTVFLHENFEVEVPWSRSRLLVRLPDGFSLVRV